MKKTTQILCYIVIAAAVVWSALAIGNGKIVSIFGVEIFAAAKNDMMAALVLNMVAIVGLLILGAIAVTDRTKVRS